MKKRQQLEYLLAVTVMLLLFFISVFSVNYFFKKELSRQQETYLLKKADFLETQLENTLFEKEQVNPAENARIKSYTDKNDDRISLLSPTGRTFYDTDDKNLTESRADRPEIKAVIAGAAFGTDRRISETLNKELFYLAVPIKNDGQLVGILRISEEASKFSKSLITFRNFLSITFGLLFLTITLFLLLMIRQKNKPLLTVLPFLKKMVQDPRKNRSIIQQSSEWNELYETANKLSKKMSKTYQAYTSTEEQLHILLNDLMIGVFIIDKNGDLELINPVMCRFLGIKKTPKDRDNYLNTISDPLLIQLINQSISEEQNIQQEITLHADSEERILDLSLHFFNQKSNHHQIFGIAYDLTQLRKLEKMQKDFVGNVSHELKTPVTSLIGFTETLLDGAKDDPETLTEFLTIIQKDAYRLQRLIQEIILLSRDAKTNYEQQNIHLVPLLNEIIHSYSKTIKDKELQLVIQGDSDFSFTVIYELFYPIVKNLIENAVQYSNEKGTVTVRFDVSEHLLTLTVQDNGIGISLEEQKRIFERFYRVDKARARNSGGTGLGLAIVQNYSSLLGGTVTAESYPGIGSAFTLKIPI